MRLARVVLALLALLLAACGGGPSAPTPTVPLRTDYRLGLVTDVGTVRDGTFNELAHQGALRVARDFGLDYTFRESIDESHYAIHLQDLLADSRNIIVTVGYLMTDATVQAARDNPDVYFIGLDQAFDETLPNLVGLQFREDQAGFLVGALAGMMTETNVVGALGGQQTPPVTRFINGFVNGVNYVRPGTRVLRTYAPSFTDPDLGSSIVRDWVGQGADVIFGAGGLTGSAGILAASRLGAWVIGVDQDEYRTTFSEGTVDGADRVLTSAVKRVDAGLYRAVASILDGSFQPGVITLSAAECGVAYAPFHDAEEHIPAGIRERLDAMWRALAGGTVNTGASGIAGDVPPAPLAGLMPPVAEDAPRLEECNF